MSYACGVIILYGVKGRVEIAGTDSRACIVATSCVLAHVNSFVIHSARINEFHQDSFTALAIEVRD